MSRVSFTEFESKYRYEGQISQGSFGRVLRVKEIKTKKSYALKKLIIRRIQELKDVETEIRLLSAFQHPLIVEVRAGIT